MTEEDLPVAVAPPMPIEYLPANERITELETGLRCTARLLAQADDRVAFLEERHTDLQATLTELVLANRALTALRLSGRRGVEVNHVGPGLWPDPAMDAAEKTDAALARLRYALRLVHALQRLERMHAEVMALANDDTIDTLAQSDWARELGTDQYEATAVIAWLRKHASA